LSISAKGVISAGIHDITIPDITSTDYISNVHWYLTLLQPVCGHFIWLSSTAPKFDLIEFSQTKAGMTEYRDAVKEFIGGNAEFSEMSSFVDVFDASIHVRHGDHIHMAESWYQELGDWFVTLMR
jgi:hypothetical protein